MTHGLGLIPSDGRHDNAMAALSKPTCAVRDADIPDEVDPADTLTITDQGPFNSCCGCATDKALERDHFIECQEVINLSARFSYLAARTMDGSSRGPDAGAMIEGGARGAAEMGCVEESDFPYWPFDENAFDPHIPEPILQLAAKHKVRSIARMGSMDDIIRFIGSGQGAVIYGMWWSDGMMNYRGESPISRSFGSGSQGGHALCIAGYKNIGGEKWPKTWNSHGRDWGDGGTFTAHPDVLWNAIRSAPWGAWGISGLSSFTVRPFKGFEGINA